MKFDFIPVKFPHYAHYLANYAYQISLMRFLFNADGCEPPELTVLLLAGVGVFAFAGLPSTSPSSDELLSPSAPQWQSRHKTLDAVLTRNGFGARRACIIPEKLRIMLA